MFPEVGHVALILSLCLYICLAVIPLVGVQLNNTLLMNTSRPLAFGGFTFIFISFLCLVQAFLVDDFSVAYVANHSTTLLPEIYKVSAVWGGHEGSLLLWVLILAGWTFAVSVFSRHLPIDMLARVLAVMGMIGIGFLLFTLLTSNPFERILPFPPTEGSDLNPLLQDPGLIIHPPMLYMGYVGFSVVFAFAIAALMSGRLDSAWARWSRPWTTVAWSFLTAGIALGSWWAYYELGWGGWWFWDPVENASFMPWLVGTALIHSLAVTEKRGVFKSWTILLAIFAFSLSLLGTFLVRSGVLTSVHAFANDPERGAFILVFLLLVVGGSLLLYALRAPAVKSTTSFDWLSRELFLLGNNIILVVIMLTVLLGTLYPLFSDALGWGKLSVGPPYFNAFFVPLMGFLCVLIGIGPLTLWKKTNRDKLLTALKHPLFGSIALGLLFPLVYGDSYSFFAALTVSLALWIVLTLAVDIRQKIRNASSIPAGLSRLTRSYYGMVVAHIGVAVTVLGACLNTIYSDQQDVRMEEGERFSAGRYEYHLVAIKNVRGPNYDAQQGQLDVYKDGKLTSRLLPEKRQYFSGGNIMTEAGIDSGFFGDIYVALGESLGETPEGKAVWAVRLHDKPFVPWIWIGSILMSFGGLLAISDKRYRLKRQPSSVSVKQPSNEIE
ncbi:heme lyase CcmF/NrfE family subunit [Eionea flava]